MSTTRAVWLGVCLAVTTGCVTQKTYDSLRGERDGLETTLEEKNEALRKLEAHERKLDDDNRQLQAGLDAARDQVKDLEARILRLSNDIALATKDKSRLQASVEQMTTALAELERRRAAAEARVNEFKQLLARFRGLIDAGKLKVRIVDGRMVVVLATDILFGSGSAALSSAGRGAIGEVAQVLRSIPGRAFQVEGHTDAVPITTAQFPSNWELAAARAINVVKAMVEAGLPSTRVSAASFGDTHPVASNDSVDGKAQNRRIEIIIVPDLSGLPGFDELNKLDGQR